MFHPEGPTFFELARECLSSTEHGYDLLAPKFEHTPFRTPDAILEIALSHAGTADRALDLCCGTGAAMVHLRPRCREALVGLDFSGGMIAEARGRLEAALAPGSVSVGFVRADALAIPFAEAFDLVTCFGAFGHILKKDEPRFVSSIRAALRPGGRFLFATTGHPPPLSPSTLVSRAFNAVMRIRNALFSPEFVMYYLTFLLPEVKSLLEEHGFSVEVREGPFPRPFERARVVIATRL